MCKALGVIFSLRYICAHDPRPFQPTFSCSASLFFFLFTNKKQTNLNRGSVFFNIHHFLRYNKFFMMLKRGRALDSPAADDIIVVSSTATPSYRTPFFNAIQQNLGSSWSISNIQNIEHTNSENLSRCVIFEAEEESRIRESDITWLRRKYSKCFIVIYQPSAVNGTIIFLNHSAAALPLTLTH